MQYAELICQSNFSFLQGASHPQELARTAHELGYSTLALTDECSLSGVVRAYAELKQLTQNRRDHGEDRPPAPQTANHNPHRHPGEGRDPEKPLKLICGSLFKLQSESNAAQDRVTKARQPGDEAEGNCQKIVLIAPTRTAYSELCQLISTSRLRAEKGRYITYQNDLLEICHECIAIWLPSEKLEVPGAIKDHFKERLYLAFSNQLLGQQNLKNHQLLDFARQSELPLVATNAVLMHSSSRKPLQDVLNANFHHCTLDKLGYRLEQNAERYLRTLEDIATLFPRESIDNTIQIAEQCHFCLSELRYQYPSEVIPKGKSASSHLRELVETGEKVRWPNGPAAHIAEQIETELALIAELEYEHYFLTIYDIVQYARSQHILYQGRGSAANSVVCYCLFITEIDPHRIGLLFERFISRERNEPPDIDVDFEHERREEIIQYIYQKYGRHRAGLAASKTTYRFKSALRDIGKALGIGSATIEQLIAERAWWDTMDDFPRQMQKVGIDPNSATGRMLPELMGQIYGFPRHLSQHVGGFVITEQPLHTLVPIENAAMDDRTIVQWDKEDIEDLKLMKVDILALGMLTALRKSLTYIGLYGPKLRLQDIPPEDPAVYEMMCRADTVGVFQIESRAQMSMLPRLQPRNFYELTIEIAIVRPGPIQGGMVHPYLKRKQGLEPVTYPHENLRPVLERTLGVPIFQEQVIKLSMVAAGFNGGEADQLRRAMASWGKNGNLNTFKDKLIQGMQANSYRADFAEQLFQQMKGFGAYGFPESHSASFALLAYFSAWIKHHHPAAFYCGLLNSQPMGFYAPAQLVYDAQRHNVKVLPINVLYSQWDHRLELPGPTVTNKQPSQARISSSPRRPGSITTKEDKAAGLRLGMRLIKGLDQQSAEAIATTRGKTTFNSLAHFRQTTNLPRDQITLLASANAFHSLEENRYNNAWRSLSLESTNFAVELHSPPHTLEDDTYSDYSSTGLSLREHPIALLRKRKEYHHALKASELPKLKDGHQVTVIGLVTCRQRPGSASGVMFLTLEDETGAMNLVVWENTQQLYRAELTRGKVLKVNGSIQKGGEYDSATPIHVIAKKVVSIEWSKIQEVRSFH
ncbi:error-prone DNA polymerase [Microbulbifer flavimaris]|uniref:Error-prone DNA polymerase n=1 Tax=Microbulbifer flavimaris TaxID=1781068 RepID=A0ABX4I1D5_9GAMM|nr:MULTISPECIES: error-prone DNA polymerase [Microbulbifer]KUJ84152.1 DNA polymerase [Microbulbifer sp. ZGT114]PCO06225.1 error-prone DNA polymerase [Microbulbifer flavimaris]